MIKQSATFVVDKTKIPYARYIKTFGMQEQAYFYTIDLREPEVRKRVEGIELFTEEGFHNFEDQYLAPIFFQTKAPLQYNLYLVFVMPDDMSITSDMWKIKQDFQYMRKLFLKKSEFAKLLLEDYKKEICSFAHIGEERYKIRNFNVLSDLEPRNNLELLKALSETLKSPVQDIAFPNEEDYIRSIRTCDTRVLGYYYQKLWSMFGETGVPENPYQLSSTEQEMLYLASILTHQQKGQPLLIDGVVWRRLDGARKLNLLTTLNDFSEQQGSVLVTCDSKSDIELIKKKIYRPNFLMKHEQS